MHNEVLLLAGILTLGILCQWVAWRLKIPAILPLLATGFIVGPVTGLLNPQELLGDLFFPVISLSVAIILFEGSLTLRWQEVSHVAGIVRNLITLGALITWIGGALAAHFIVGLSTPMAILFGALIAVTGPTVINPLLRNVRPVQKLSSILRWEGILIDPVGASLAVLIFDFLVAEGSGSRPLLLVVQTFVLIVLVGGIVGMVGGWLIRFLLRRYLVPDYLRDIAVLAVVAAIFAISDSLQSESGLLAVTVMGVYLANQHVPQLHHVWHFKERLSVLLVSSLFILLAANIEVTDLALLDWSGLLLLAFVIFILRPFGVQLSALGSRLSRNERLFLSWIAPRGIVAAAVSSLFAFRLEELGFEDAPVLAPLVFLVIVGTVFLQGSTAKLVARRLGVAEAEPQGFLLMGAHHFARQLAIAIQKAGFTVRLVDLNLQNVVEARAAGLEVYHDNILADVTESEVDLSGVGRLLALTSNDEANALACVHLRDVFDSSEAYQLPPRGVQTASRERLGRLLFSPQATYDNLDQWTDSGATIETKILNGRPFSLHDKSNQGNLFVPLVAFCGTEAHVFTSEGSFTPPAGWTLLSLVSPAEPQTQLPEIPPLPR